MAVTIRVECDGYFDNPGCEDFRYTSSNTTAGAREEAANEGGWSCWSGTPGTEGLDFCPNCVAKGKKAP